MTKHRIPILLLAALCSVAASWPIGRVAQSVVKLETPIGMCSAVVITKELAMTATHCLHDQMAVGRAPAFTVEQEPHEEGIAVIRGTWPQARPIKLAPMVEPGDDLLVVGFGLNSPELLFFPGVAISHRLTIPGKALPSLWISAPAVYGFSGGPVVDRKGRLVSINIGGFLPETPLHTVSTAAPVESVRQLYQKHTR